jgi:hypothetical protein
VLVEEVLEEQSVRARPLDGSESRRLLDTWRRTFARPAWQQNPPRYPNEFEWHAFSYEYAYALNGASAESAYADEEAPTFYVLSAARSDEGFECASRHLPRLAALSQDLIVVPTTFAWTMVFTHETSMGLGPYFTRAEWREKETKDNAASGNASWRARHSKRRTRR